MIFELLGPSLELLFEQFNRKFSLKTILIMADQMLTRIENIHRVHVIHRDIKPENFLIGNLTKKNRIYLIDFGLAKRFRNPNTGMHNRYKDGKSLTGTARYASIYSLLGIEQSRRDDLESLAYTLIYFGVGSLPWQNIRAKTKKDKYDLILEKKINTKVEDIIKDLPEEFGEFLHYTRSLQFEEKPDYMHLRKLLSKMFEKNDFELDMICDWTSFMEKREKMKNKNNKTDNNSMIKKDSSNKRSNSQNKKSDPNLSK